MAIEGFGRALRDNPDLRRDTVGNMDHRLNLVLLFLFPVIISFSFCDGQGILTDVEGLMAFKASADLRGALNISWTGITNPCGNATTLPWLGIKCNTRGRVYAVLLDSLQLTGTFADNTLSRLHDLRYLVVSNNSFKGSIPNDLSNVTGLLQLWAQGSQFSGPYPQFLTASNRLVKVNLAGNKFAGPIPNLTALTTLIMLNLSTNNFTGEIPSLPPQLSILDLSSNALNGNIPPDFPSTLTNLSLTHNQLTGKIPASLASKFTSASFTGNAGLCGPPTSTPCLPIPDPAPQTTAPQAQTPVQPNTSAVGVSSDLGGGKKHPAKKLSAVDIAVIVVADAIVLIAITLGLLCYYSRRYSKDADEKPAKKVSDTSTVDSQKFSIASTVPEAERNKLVFVDDGYEHKFDLEDLLRASAEMLGKGSFGTAYKAVLEGGMTVAVKRLRDAKDMGKKEFDQQMEVLGRLRHANLVPLRAFYYAKEEKLLVYDFMTNGSLFSLLHGNRGPGRTPLGWTSRLRIAKGVAAGLSHLHHECESQKIPHGNIKSSNVLLGPNFEVCISDFGLAPLMTPTMAAQRMAGYLAPEYSHMKRISQKADVYSFGVLLLELLTGRQPEHSLQGDGIDLPKWVQSVVREEWTGEVFDRELKSFGNQEEEMVSLLQISMGCVTSNPDHRPKMAQVQQLIEDIGQGESFMDSESLSFDSHLEENDYGLRDASVNL